MRGLHTCNVSDLQMLVFPSSSDKTTNGVIQKGANPRGMRLLEYVSGLISSFRLCMRGGMSDELRGGKKGSDALPQESIIYAELQLFEHVQRQDKCEIVDCW